MHNHTPSTKVPPMMSKLTCSQTCPVICTAYIMVLGLSGVKT